MKNINKLAKRESVEAVKREYLFNHSKNLLKYSIRQSKNYKIIFKENFFSQK